MYRIKSRLFLSLVLASLCVPAMARENGPDWYTVEVIVFAHLNPDAIQEENWPQAPGMPDLTNSVELSQSGALMEEALQGEPGQVVGGPRAFVSLAPAYRELRPIWRRLRGSRQYRPLIHLAWRQPGLPETEATTIHLHTRRPSDQFPARSDNRGIGPTPAPGPYGPAVTDVFPAPEPLTVDGTFKLYRARYLHAQVDLRYYRPAHQPARSPQPSPVAPAAGAGMKTETEATPMAMDQPLEETPLPTLFRLTERRRMRSGELHYLDHPLFGVLVKATPYDTAPAAEVAPPEPASQSPAPPSPASEMAQ